MTKPFDLRNVDPNLVGEVRGEALVDGSLAPENAHTTELLSVFVMWAIADAMREHGLAPRLPEALQRQADAALERCGVELNRRIPRPPRGSRKVGS